MLLHESPYIAALVLTAVVALAAALYFSRRAARGVVPFVALMAGVAWWATFYALELATPDLHGKLFWFGLKYVGIVTLPPAYVQYVLRYTDQEGLLRGRARVLLAAEPLFVLLVLWTNGAHHWMWTEASIASQGGAYGVLALDYGWAYWVHMVYSGALSVLGQLVLARYLIHASPLHRRQTAALMLAGFLPLLAALASMVQAAPLGLLDLSPLAALLAGLIMGYGLLRFDLPDVLPVAREVTLEHVAEGVVVVSRGGRVVDANAAALALAGLTRGQAVGRPAAEVLSFVPAALERAGGLDTWQGLEEWTQAGQVRQLDLFVSLLRGRRGQESGHVVVIRDITERLAVENELLARSNELAELYDTSLAIASELDLQKLLPVIVERANRLLAAMGTGLYLYDAEKDNLFYQVGTGLSEQFVGSSLGRGEGLSGRVLETELPLAVEDYHHWPGRSLQFEAQVVGSVLGVPVRWRGRVLGVVEVQREAGRPFTSDERRLMDLFASQAASALGNARLYQAAQRELQERRLAESALRASEARYRATVQDQTEQIYRIKPDLTITFANDAACRFHGVLPQQVVGRSVLEDILPEDQAGVRQILGMISPEQPVLVSENHNVGADQQQHWFQWTNRGIFDESGRLVELLSVGRNIDERKSAEADRERLEEQLRLAQRTEAVGILAGGVAHEFNNLLTVIRGNVELLQADLAEQPAALGPLEAIARTAQRATALTRQLLALSRRQVLQRVPTDLNDLVTSFAPLLRHAVGQLIQVHVQTEPNLGRVLADPGAMEQVLMNLAINARDAMPEGGLLVVSTRPVDADPAFCDAHPAVAPGHYACLTVSDTGSGMDDATRRHLFEPFYTTKEVGKGTGLGLSVVYGIVRQHEGFIEVHSEPGKGTVIDIYLPLGGQQQ
ncbi:MAG TPA: histidine kinase N-terminal 7TM domain-containing protein [Anaerolineae bacterium]|nr:histidine kinase N-terminal 7TM domain-containing protein [Anaerolineae bacterium]